MEPKLPDMTPQQAELSRFDQHGFNLYRRLAVGDGSLLSLIGYELATLICASLPGLVGFGARSLVYPALFRRCLGKPAIGRGVVIRIPGQIELGRSVMIDDYAVLDVRGREGSISIGSGAAIGRFTTLAAKQGRIEIADGANIGSYCRIATQSKVIVERSVLVAAYCYIGPGNHKHDPERGALITQDMEIRGGVVLGEGCWIGAHSTLLDGVRVGKNSIVGANSLVVTDVPDGALVAGTPAKVIHR